jgi:hypothetical protein
MRRLQACMHACRAVCIPAAPHFDKRTRRKRKRAAVARLPACLHSLCPCAFGTQAHHSGCYSITNFMWSISTVHHPCLGMLHTPQRQCCLQSQNLRSVDLSPLAPAILCPAAAPVCCSCMICLPCSCSVC